MEFTSNNTYKLLGDRDEDAPEEKQDNWRHPPNLDKFFRSMYNYYSYKGFSAILLTQACSILSLGFTIFFSVYMIAFFNWNALPGCRDETTCQNLNQSFHRNPFNETPTVFLFLTCVYMILFGALWLWRCGNAMNEITEAMEMEKFYREILGIKEPELESIQWYEVVQRLIDLHQSGMYRVVVNEKLTVHDVVIRIMRKENYMIGLINKNTMDLSVPWWLTPCMPSRLFLTKSLEWSLSFCITEHMFDEQFDISQDFLDDLNGLKWRFQAVGLIHFILLPFMIVYMIISFFLQNAQQFHSSKAYLGPRQWSPLALWQFREFNELPHLFDERMNKAYDPANDYISLYHNPYLAIIARFVTYVSGALVATLLLISFISEEVLLYIEVGHHNLLWYLGILSAIFAGARTLIPDETKTKESSYAILQKLSSFIHYSNPRWESTPDSPVVREEINDLFQYKAQIFLMEILSVILTPAVLCFSLPISAKSIVDFVKHHTQYVEGVGAVCDFCMFDLNRYGDEHYGCEKDGYLDPKQRPEHGKLEQSIMNFHKHYPNYMGNDGTKALTQRIHAFRDINLHNRQRVYNQELEKSGIIMNGNTNNIQYQQPYYSNNNNNNPYVTTNTTPLHTNNSDGNITMATTTGGGYYPETPSFINPEQLLMMQQQQRQHHQPHINNTSNNINNKLIPEVISTENIAFSPKTYSDPNFMNNNNSNNNMSVLVPNASELESNNNSNNVDNVNSNDSDNAVGMKNIMSTDMIQEQQQQQVLPSKQQPQPLTLQHPPLHHQEQYIHSDHHIDNNNSINTGMPGGSGGGGYTVDSAPATPITKSHSIDPITGLIRSSSIDNEIGPFVTNPTQHQHQQQLQYPKSKPMSSNDINTNAGIAGLSIIPPNQLKPENKQHHLSPEAEDHSPIIRHHHQYDGFIPPTTTVHTVTSSNNICMKSGGGGGGSDSNLSGYPHHQHHPRQRGSRHSRSSHMTTTPPRNIEMSTFNQSTITGSSARGTGGGQYSTYLHQYYNNNNNNNNMRNSGLLYQSTTNTGTGIYSGGSNLSNYQQQQDLPSVLLSIFKQQNIDYENDYYWMKKFKVEHQQNALQLEQSLIHHNAMSKSMLSNNITTSNNIINNHNIIRSQPNSGENIITNNNNNNSNNNINGGGGGIPSSSQSAVGSPGGFYYGMNMTGGGNYNNSNNNNNYNNSNMMSDSNMMYTSTSASGMYLSGNLPFATNPNNFNNNNNNNNNSINYSAPQAQYGGYYNNQSVMGLMSPTRRAMNSNNSHNNFGSPPPYRNKKGTQRTLSRVGELHKVEENTEQED